MGLYRSKLDMHRYEENHIEPMKSRNLIAKMLQTEPVEAAGSNVELWRKLKLPIV